MKRIPHTKIRIDVFRRLEPIFGMLSEEVQQELHRVDSETSWFGYGTDNKQKPYLHSSNRLTHLLYETQHGQFKERFPHLVSFVGQTGKLFDGFYSDIMCHE